MLMARKSSGMAVLDVAKEILRRTKSVDELRILQAVIFPLEKGMTIAETAACIGRSGGRQSIVRLSSKREGLSKRIAPAEENERI